MNSVTHLLARGMSALLITCIPAMVIALETDDSQTRAVEIGPGGNIKLEKPARTKLEAQSEWHAHLLWESRYITEGRDNLNGKGMISASTEFTYRNLSIVPWVADGIDTDYSEANLNLIYGMKLSDDLELYAGYNLLHAREGGVSNTDGELSLDAAYFHAKRFQLLASVYHSFDANGTFAEFALKKGYRLNKRLSLSARAVVGINAGYVPDGHNGLNHAQLRANATFQPLHNMDIYAYAGYNKPINRDENRYPGDALLRDFFWGGAGMTYRF